jgi:hypothetical protein
MMLMSLDVGGSVAVGGGPITSFQQYTPTLSHVCQCVPIEIIFLLIFNLVIFFCRTR